MGTIPKTVRLLNWLINPQFRDKVEELRAVQDEELQKVIKKSLPAITPSGLFSYRAEKDLIEHSGFLAFDIDFSDNGHIYNFSDLKEQISHIASVAYCGLSVRGKGYWGLVPVPKSSPEIHKQRFSALVLDFKEFGINLDLSGSDICRLRIYSWDNDAYFNHSAKMYTKLVLAHKKGWVKCPDTRDKVELIIKKVMNEGKDITGDYKEEWLKIAMALYNEFGEGGRDYFHAVSKFHPEYRIRDTDKTFDNVKKHDYSKVTIGSFFKIASDYGIRLSEDSVEVSDIHIATRKEQSELTFMKKPVVKEDSWDHEIKELADFFESIKIPLEPFDSPFGVITDVPLFIESQLAFVKAQNGNTRYLPYLERLNELKIILSRN